MKRYNKKKELVCSFFYWDKQMSHTNGMGPVKYTKGLRVIFRIKKINRIRLRLMMLEKWQ